jgi:hypothetical protein
MYENYLLMLWSGNVTEAEKWSDLVEQCADAAAAGAQKSDKKQLTKKRKRERGNAQVQA